MRLLYLFFLISLPGPEALLEVGKSDGQTKLIREGAGVMCYNWSAAEQKWNKIGDVLGAGGGSPGAGKTMHEGKVIIIIIIIEFQSII